MTKSPQSNTPLLPVKKPDDLYVFVHGVRAVNEDWLTFQQMYLIRMPWLLELLQRLFTLQWNLLQRSLSVEP